MVLGCDYLNNWSEIGYFILSELLCSAHLEVDKLADEEINDMYLSLLIHFDDLIGRQINTSRIEHSYDERKELYRFDLSQSGKSSNPS